MFLAARLLFAGSLIAAPWLLGGAEAFLTPCFVWPLVGSVLLSAAAVFRHGGSGGTRAWWLITPTLLGALLGVVQLAPVFGPAGAGSAAASLRAELSLEAVDGPTPLSLSPAATRRQIAWLLIAASTLWQSATLFRDPVWRRRMLAAFATNGAVLSIFSVAQAATWRGQMFWIGPEVASGPPPVGPFVYHNQAGAYFATCAACFLGWFLAGRQDHAATGRASSLLQASVGLCLLGGLLASYSRGALLCSLAAALLTVIAARRQISLRWASLAAGGVGAVAVGLVVLATSTERTNQRLASLADDQLYQQDGRLDHWPVALRAAGEFWGLGAGLGAYKHVNPLFEQQPSTRAYERAHNQYLEALVEGGVIALSLLLTALAAAGLEFWRAARSVDRVAAAAGAAAFAALAFQALHGVVDFCLYLPANLVLFAAVAGVGMVGRSGGLLPSKPGVAALAPIVLLAGAACWSASVLQRGASVDLAIKQLPWRSDDSAFSVEQADRWVASLSDASAACPDDAEAWQALGEALLLRYRLAARESLSKELGVAADNPRLWEVTKPSQLLSTAAGFHSQGAATELDELRNQPVIAENLPAARRAFRASNTATPLLPKPLSRLLSLSWLDTPPAPTGGLIERATRLSPMRAGRLFEVGSLAFLARNYADALKPWRNALEMDPDYAAQVIPLANLVLPADRVIDELLPGDPALLYRVYAKSLSEPQRQRLGPRLLDRAIGLLGEGESAEAARPPEAWRLLGRLQAAAGRPAAAVEAYSVATDKRPTEIEWRYEHAVQLAELGRIVEARKEAVFCVRLSPATPRYVNLLGRLKRETPP